LPDSRTATEKPGGLDAALRRAREFEAAHFEAVLAVRDAELLRLEALKADLAPIVAAHDRAREYFDLAISPGEPPRLWIDLLASVTMAPDPRSYRLAQDLPLGREVLLDTIERAEMVEKIKEYMAHRLVARERQIAAATKPRLQPDRYSSSALLLTWMAGFAAGALAVAIAFIILKRWNF
jgi:hypothetical protein